MPKKTKSNLSLAIDQVIGKARAVDNSGIVDVLTFCNDSRYLNFLGQTPQMILWPMQKIVLKMFYRGTRGNEHLQLTEYELEMLREIGRHEDLDYVEKYGGFDSVIEKYRRWQVIDTLLLIMGRRSSKTTMVSIIATYEAYKLLEMGNPHLHYGITPDKRIAIINVAVSAKQAYNILFREIESRVARSPYFADKVNFDASLKGEICMLTDTDKMENERRRRMGIKIMQPGSVVLMSGHSNSDSLRGEAAIAVLFDEVAHFMNSAGRNSADEVFNALTPSVRQFGSDGKIVLLSDPQGRDGVFWRLFQSSQEQKAACPKCGASWDEATPGDKCNDCGTECDVTYPNDGCLALQIPTWRINPQPDLSKEKLEKTAKKANPIEFASTWGAKFTGEQGTRFFDERRVDDCIDPRHHEALHGQVQYNYYLHLDPATTSHNYALVLVHPVTYVNPLGEKRRRVFVDVVRYWTPTCDGPVNIGEVERTILDLCKLFNVKMVTFDSFQSAQTIQNLKRRGINARETPFRSSFINRIYGQLKVVINMSDLVMYPHEQLVGEIKNLQYKITGRGFKRMFDPTSHYPSDDLADALAGAVYQALNKQVKGGLPRSRTVFMGSFMSGGR